MLNLFKKQWLPDYIREYILKTFPAKLFRVEFIIGGKSVELSQVVGNERHVEYGVVTYIDTEGNTESETIGTNASGYTTTYKIVRLYQPSLGTLTAVVS